MTTSAAALASGEPGDGALVGSADGGRGGGGGSGACDSEGALPLVVALDDDEAEDKLLDGVEELVAAGPDSTVAKLAGRSESVCLTRLSGSL